MGMKKNRKGVRLRFFLRVSEECGVNARRVEPETPTAVIFGNFTPFFLEIHWYSFVITAQISSKIPRRKVIYQF